MEENTIILFDIDGTLCAPGKQVDDEMKDLLFSLKDKYMLGLVGGGTYEKLKNQFEFENCFGLFTYVFSENGVVSYKNCKNIRNDNIIDKLGEENINKIILCLKQMIKKLYNDIREDEYESYIDLRKGLIYFTLVKRGSNDDIRKEFIEKDEKENLRINMINLLKKELEKLNLDLDIALGGSTGININPAEWNKSYSLTLIEDNFIIYYFGDRIHPHGNDYKIATHERVYKYFKVNNIKDTKQIIKNIKKFGYIDHNIIKNK